MRAVADALFAVLAILITLALAGDRIARALSAATVPLCVLFVGLIVTRLAWFYTSRW
ncbi:MAG: hypothetical protein ACTHKT_14325 [Solirubrobacterales bacterium]